ncbi:hypothetical protein GW17_00041734 [Ensete ventricosum]|nr:hypothetical protein GW17_00041734 [Ensete ventricosum]
MSQERPQPSNPVEHLGEEIPTTHHALGLEGRIPLPPHRDENTLVPTPSYYWRLFNDLGFSPPGHGMGHPAVSTEAFSISLAKSKRWQG